MLELHYDPAYFSDPQKYDTERFSDEKYFFKEFLLLQKYSPI